MDSGSCCRFCVFFVQPDDGENYCDLNKHDVQFWSCCNSFKNRSSNKVNKNKKIVLDHGFVELLDHMGDDNSVANSARVSYQGQKPIRDNKKLINYLIRHKHLTPLEQAQVRFRVKCPIFIARQIFRHRTGKFNEISGRYSELKEEFYIPNLDRYKVQSTKNRQGTGDYSMTTPENWQVCFRDQCHNAFHLYQSAIEAGMSREVARIILPLNTYTEFVFSIDLRNLFNFLKLRMDSHAQWEIQQYAYAIYDLIRPLFPACFDAFDNYINDSMELSGVEQRLMNYLYNIPDLSIFRGDPTVFNKFFEENEMTAREGEEFLEKFEWLFGNNQ